LKAVCSKVHHDKPSLHGQKFVKFLSLTRMNCTQVLFPATTTELVLHSYMLQIAIVTIIRELQYYKDTSIVSYIVKC